MNTDISGAASAWVNIKLFLIPRLGATINFIYFASLLWLIFMTTIGGSYILVPGFRDILDATKLSNIFISQTIKDKLASNDYSNTKIFIQYICLKHLLLLGVIFGVKFIVFNKILGI